MPSRYEVDDPELKRMLLDIAGSIRKGLPGNWGFSLFLFRLGGDGVTFYISSIEREDFIESLREFLMNEGYATIPAASSPGRQH